MSYLTSYIGQRYWNICCKFKKIQPNRILFISFLGESYSDNPRAVSESLHSLYSDADIVWAFKNKAKRNFPSYVTPIDYTNRYLFYYTLVSSKIVVSNNSLSFPKREGQYFIQLWHGDRAFKKVLYDSPYCKDEVINESLDGFCDLAVAGSEYGIRQFRSAFHYRGEIMSCGTPRDDCLVNINKSKLASTKQKLCISADEKILLYAPTYRRKYQESDSQIVQDINFTRLLYTLEEKYHCKWTLLVRAHPLMMGLSGFEKNMRIIDVSNAEDMADLLMIADMLITDYSSCAGDFVLLNRPVILYQADYEQYLREERTFYFNMDESPYMIAHNQLELENWIHQLNNAMILKNCKDIMDFYGTCESGRASETVAKRIIQWMGK